MAEDMYHSEVVETEMEALTVGAGNEYADKAEWVESKIAEYLDAPARAAA